jgi:hypothetical protein
VATWCDKLASTPSVGFLLNANFVPGDILLQQLIPLLNRWVKAETPQFTIDQHESFQVLVNTYDGFQYGVQPSRVFVGFQHRMKTKFISGGLPRMELISKPEPYSTLLQEAIERLVASTLLVAGKKRLITRVGIVATAKVAEEDLPPGIAKAIKYFCRPWHGTPSEAYHVQFAGILRDTAKLNDRCVHTLIKQEDSEEPLTVTLDWQRRFTDSRAVSKDNVVDILKAAQSDALAYFEEVAEGSRFDEDLISSQN